MTEHPARGGNADRSHVSDEAEVETLDHHARHRLSRGAPPSAVGPLATDIELQYQGSRSTFYSEQVRDALKRKD